MSGEPMKYNGNCNGAEPIEMSKDKIVEFLWGLLDDIDTADDMFKENSEGYRKYAQNKQKQRWATGITTDGYTVTMPRHREVDELKAALKEANEDMIWMSGSSDFSPGGKAYEGWEPVRERLSKRLKATEQPNE